MPSRKVLAILVTLSALAIPAPTVLGAKDDACEPTIDRSQSVARHWDEVLLDGIRRDLPAPTIHSRNLYHVSAAMWDAWAAYDPTADGVFVDRKVDTEGMSEAQIRRARETAMSYAAYRILSDRYKASPGAEETPGGVRRADGVPLPSRSAATAPAATRPRRSGNRIARAILAAGKEDGSNELGGYKPPDYAPANEPMIVARPGTVMANPDRWQPLALEESVSQNGLPLPDKVQSGARPALGTRDPLRDRLGR